jgi:acetolactate synthase-1/2/3 large subunit
MKFQSEKNGYVQLLSPLDNPWLEHIGDGSFMIEQQELATVRYHNIPLMVLALRNNAYGGMKRDQIKNYNGRVFGTELFIPDLAKLAALYDAKGFSITRKDELKPVFQ